MPTWEDIARDHGRFLYTVAYRLTGNHEDAQDLVQEVLLRVRRGLATFTPGSLEGWLSRITTNAFLDDVRKRKRRPLEVVPDLPDALVGVDADPEAALAAQRLPDDVQDALRALPPDFRAPLVLCDVVGLDYAEIASTLEIPPAPCAADPPRARPPAEGADGMMPHAGDLLSAYADGELSATERATIDDHLVTCPSCRQELVATTEAKSWVTSLPEVLAPFGFYERMLLDPAGGRARRRTWATRIGVVGLAATASIWLGVLALSGLDGRRPSGVPALNSLVSLHDQSSPASTDERSAPEAHASACRQVDLASARDADRGAGRHLPGREGAVGLLYQRYEIGSPEPPGGRGRSRARWRVGGVDRAGRGRSNSYPIGHAAVIFVGGDPRRRWRCSAAPPGA